MEILGWETPAGPRVSPDMAGQLHMELENWAARCARDMLEDIRTNQQFDYNLQLWKKWRW